MLVQINITCQTVRQNEQKIKVISYYIFLSHLETAVGTITLLYVFTYLLRAHIYCKKEDFYILK